MEKWDFDNLDKIVLKFRMGNEAEAFQLFAKLTTNKKKYVAVASSRTDLLGHETIARALAEMGPVIVDEMIERHRYESLS